MAGRRAHDVGALRWLGRLVVRLSRGEGRRRRGQGRGATFSAEQMRAPRHWSDRPEYGGNELLFPRTAKRQQLLSVSTFAVSCMVEGGELLPEETVMNLIIVSGGGLIFDD
jgi:hypothetical protein